MTDQAASNSQDDVTERLRRLAEVLFAPEGSDTRAGLGHLVREIEAVQLGFIARLNAANDTRRLGLRTETSCH